MSFFAASDVLVVSLTRERAIVVTPSEKIQESARGPSDTELIITAVSNNDLPCVEQLLRDSPELARTRTVDGVSLLLSAKYQGADEIAKRFAVVRVDLDISEAAAMGNLGQVRNLIARDRGILSQVSADGFTPLHLAIFFKQIDVARYLLANGADVEAVARNNSAVRPIHSAAATRDARVVRVILAAGADADTKQTGGHTALHSAVLHHNVPMATILLAAGADPTIRNDRGQSALELADGGGAHSIKELLVAVSEYYSHSGNTE